MESGTQAMSMLSRVHTRVEYSSTPWVVLDSTQPCKIPCRYHFQVDYELCVCDVMLLSSFKTEIVSTSIYSIIFNIADERLNLGKIDFNI